MPQPHPHNLMLPVNPIVQQVTGIPPSSLLQPYRILPRQRPVILSPVLQEIQHTANPSEKIQHQRIESIRNFALAPMTRPEDVINILVESDGRDHAFTVHRRLLSHFCPLFRDLLRERPPTVKTLNIKAFNYNNELEFDIPEDKQPGEDMEIEVKVIIKLPSDHKQLPRLRCPENLGTVKPYVFAALLEWLYCAFPGQQFPPPNSPIHSSTLIELWVLASRLKIPGCQNDCIMGIERFRKQTNIVETGMIEWVYDNTSDFPRATCGLKNLLVDQCAWILDERWLLGGIGEKNNEAMLPREFLVDLVARLRVLLREGHAIGDLGDLETKRMEDRKGRYWVEGLTS